jgi:cytochrome c biogenesis protein CcmG/thiol:disulfide interchange protein DsbE
MSTTSPSDTYYSLFGVSAQASAEQIEEAYQRQRERYSPERVAALGDEFRTIAGQRVAELERAYAVLADADQRRAYDERIGATPASSKRAARSSGLSRREIVMAAGGAFVGLLVIAAVWMFSGSSAPATRLPAAQQNRPAPGFTLPALSGGDVRLEDYRGKVVLLNFWYTGCEPCREETPALQAAYSKLSGQGLEIVGVNVRQNERGGTDGDADIAKFVDNYKVTYPIALDPDNRVNRDYQVYVLPTSVMIDQRGQIRYLMFSAITTEDVETLFNTLQQETQQAAASGLLAQ